MTTDQAIEALCSIGERMKEHADELAKLSRWQRETGRQQTAAFLRMMADKTLDTSDRLFNEAKVIES